MNKNEKNIIEGKITTGSKVYKPGDPVRIILSVENKTSEPLYLFIPAAITGKEIKLRYGTAHEIKTANEDTGIELTTEEAVLPGNSIERKYLLTERFSFEHPGSYSVECNIPIEYADESIRDKKIRREAGSIIISSVIDFEILGIIKKDPGETNLSKQENAILGWNSDRVWTGVLVNGKAVLTEQLPGKIEIEDIRNCSAAVEKSCIALAGVNKQNKKNELWLLDTSAGHSRLLFQADHLINYVTISSSGDYVCYTAAPVYSTDALTLFLYELENGKTSMLNTRVSRHCIPSWQAQGKKIICNTADNKIIAIDIENKVASALFSGTYPSISPTGSMIAFQLNNELFIWETEKQTSRKIPLEVTVPAGDLSNGMSWSHDEKFIMISHIAEIDYQLVFGIIEIATERYTVVHQNYLRGLRFQ